MYINDHDVLALDAAAAALGLPAVPFRRFRSAALLYWATPGGSEFRGSRREFWQRVALPYGRWDCAGGRAVLFNKFYEPIWVRWPTGEVRRADPTEWVRWRAQSWFYGRCVAVPLPPWRSGRTEQLCLAILADFGVGWCAVPAVGGAR